MNKYFAQVIKNVDCPVGVSIDDETNGFENGSCISYNNKLSVAVRTINEPVKQTVFEIQVGSFDSKLEGEKERIEIAVVTESYFNPQLPGGICVSINGVNVVSITQNATSFSVTSSVFGPVESYSEPLETDKFNVNNYMGIILGYINSATSINPINRARGLVNISGALSLCIDDFISYCEDCIDAYIGVYRERIEQLESMPLPNNLYDDIISDSREVIRALQERKGKAKFKEFNNQ